MCQTIWDADRKQAIERQDELAALVGGIENIEGNENEDGSHDPPDSCLCGVDLPSTLVHAGFVVWQPPNGDSMRYYFRRVATP